MYNKELSSHLGLHSPCHQWMFSSPCWGEKRKHYQYVCLQITKFQLSICHNNFLASFGLHVHSSIALSNTCVCVQAIIYNQVMLLFVFLKLVLMLLEGSVYK